MSKIRFFALAAVCWMVLSANAQMLPAGKVCSNLNDRTLFGDLNRDGEVNLADVNVLFDVILTGNFHEDDGDVTPNMTIAEFKARHWQDVVNYVDTVTQNEVIHGWVVANDVSGNIYKTLYIMDESQTGLAISINQTNLYQNYALGQEIILPMKGYWVGKYNSMQLLGYPSWYDQGQTWEANFMPQDVWAALVVPKGAPDASRVVPLEVEISDFAGMTDAETLRGYQGALVTIKGVTFVDADGTATYSLPNISTNRTVIDENGNTLIVRNSNYSDFKDVVLPTDKVDITGVLSTYGRNQTWQLYLRDINDVREVAPGPGPGDALTSLEEHFEGGLPANWLNTMVTGDRRWYNGNYLNNGYAAVTGYKGTNPPFDTWLVTPALDIKSAATRTLSFRTEVNGYGSTTSKFEVYVLNAQDPTVATLQVKLNPQIATAPASGYSDWTESGDVDLSQWADGGIYYIGFRYQADPDTNYATWCLDDVLFGK